MLQKVRTIWIDGLLTHSLTDVVRIDLGMAEQPDAVTLPLYAQYQELNHAPQTIAPGTPMIDVFARTSGALLILGAPGAEKTTLLLELARDLLDHADQDGSHPIPVVFNLSSWAEKRPALADWLIDELNMRYDVPRKIAQTWVQNDVLLPLLDGLDEVIAAQRDACVAAINVYRQEHGVSMAVCSRVADYEGLGTQLRLQGAVTVQPLTEAQIAAYLDQAGDTLVGLRAALQYDTELRKLAKTPLMLSVMSLAYRERSAKALDMAEGIENRRRHLFATYVARMFRRRGTRDSFSQEKTIQWLMWISSEMIRQAQSIFLIERLQPRVLPTRRMRQHYGLTDRLVGVVAGLVVGLAIMLIGSQVFLLPAAQQVGWGVRAHLFLQVVRGAGRDATHPAPPTKGRRGPSPPFPNAKQRPPHAWRPLLRRTHHLSWYNTHQPRSWSCRFGVNEPDGASPPSGSCSLCWIKVDLSYRNRTAKVNAATVPV